VRRLYSQIASFTVYLESWRDMKLSEVAEIRDELIEAISTVLLDLGHNHDVSLKASLKNGGFPIGYITTPFRRVSVTKSKPSESKSRGQRGSKAPRRRS